MNYYGHIWALQISTGPGAVGKGREKKEASYSKLTSVYCQPLADTSRKVISVQGKE